MTARIRHNQLQREAGFTLLELLVVLVLLALLATLLTGAIDLSVSARARVTAVSANAADFEVFQRFLNNQLRLAYPEWIKAGQHQAVDFTGTATGLQFLGPAPMVQGPGLASYSLTLGKVHGQSALILHSTYQANDGPHTLTTSFARGLQAVAFSYFSGKRDESASIWQDNWIMHATPPELIAIKISFPRKDRRVWPMLIIHPEIDADISCVIDASTHHCLGR